MPRRSPLSAAERDSLLALPDSRDELIRRYTCNEFDLAVIRQHRGFGCTSSILRDLLPTGEVANSPAHLTNSAPGVCIRPRFY